MDKKDCFQLGYISKAHGVKGEMVIALDVDNPMRYSRLESLFIEVNGQLAPFFVERVSIKGRQAIVKLEGVDSISQTELFNNASVFLPLTFLPALNDNNFYFHEIIGFSVNDKSHGIIGKAEAVLEYPGQNIIQVRDKDGHEILIPVRNEFIEKVDREGKCLYVNTPEGLIDVYLNKGKDTGGGE